MGTGIYAIQENGQLVEMTERPYDSESLLQELLEKYPNLLAGDQINSAEPRRWLLVSREMMVPAEKDGAGRWSVDHLFLDQEGIPTLVEVKRSSDTRIRREVVGQMLDYAANGVVYWPSERIRASFEANCQIQGITPEQALMAHLDESVDPEQFWQQVATNLQLGRIRMLFVADHISTELQRIVEFLNVQMSPAEVLAVEIKQFVGQGLKTLIPRVIGLTVEAQTHKTLTRRDRRQWDECSFLQAIEAQGGTQPVALVKKILAWVEEREIDGCWGKGTNWGSFVATVEHRGIRYPLFSIWTNGYIEVGFQYLQGKPPFQTEESLIGLLTSINKISDLSFPPTVITKRPSFSITVLESEANLQQFLATFDWVIQQIRVS